MKRARSGPWSRGPVEETVKRAISTFFSLLLPTSDVLAWRGDAAESHKRSKDVTNVIKQGGCRRPEEEERRREIW